MVTKRKKAVRRRSTKSKGSSGIPAWFWLLGGVLIGLGTAVVLMVRGYLPELSSICLPLTANLPRRPSPH